MLKGVDKAVKVCIHYLYDMTNTTQNHESSDTDLNSSATLPAFVYATTRDWEGYFEATKGREPRQTLLDVLDTFDRDPLLQRCAIDLGCGEGRDTAEMLRRGWKVHAIDGHPDGIKRLISREDLGNPANLTMQLAPFEAVELPACDLLNASFSLPFCAPDHFDHLWAQIVEAIRPGGRFSGQLFGERDSWATIPDRSHHTRARIEQLLEPFCIEQLKEEEREGQDCDGVQKHWHVFHIIARKHAPGQHS